MNKLVFVITPKNEDELRTRNRKKGDISRIINEALEYYFSKTSQTSKKTSVLNNFVE